MRMKSLIQGATNLVVQFVRIILKILAPHLHDQAKPFLDDIGVIRPKTTYNNKGLAPEIK